MAVDILYENFRQVMVCNHIKAASVRRRLVIFIRSIFSDESDIPPSRFDLDLRYDDAGNACAHDRLGAWQPHPGIAQVSLSYYSNLQM
jgi:hypothetical protein